MSDEKVGYKKPPKKHQFAKGKSGNPAGRPKESRNLEKILEDVLTESVIINEGGQRRKITKLEAMIKRQANQAAAGDHRSFHMIQQLVLRLKGPGLLDTQKAPLPWSDDI